MSYLEMINFCEAEKSKLTAIEQRLRLEDKKPDWMKDKMRRSSLRYGPAPYHNRFHYLSLPKEPSTELRYAIPTKLTSGMQYRTPNSVGKAFSRATATASLMSLSQIFPDPEDPIQIKQTTSSTCYQERSSSMTTAMRPHSL